MNKSNLTDDYPITSVPIGRHSFGIALSVASEVFLSSTFGDFQEYRVRVSNDLLKIDGILCPMIENQVNGWVDVVNECKTRVERSHIYVLLSGHWYGSIPPGYDISITHMEFEWAQIPTDYQRQIAVFIPNHGSKADNELKDQAHQLITKNYPSFDDHEIRMGKFRDAYSSWKLVNRFDDLDDLSGRVNIFCARNCGASLQNSAQGTVIVKNNSENLVSDVSLGLIGRNKHLDALKNIFAHIGKNAAAIPVVIHGTKNAGQREFMLQVIRTTLLRRQEQRLNARSIEQRPPKATYDGLPALLEWIANILGVHGHNPPDTITDLAERITRELCTQQLTIILDHVEYYGGTSQFYLEFWEPFYTELLRLRKIYQPKHRLICLLVHYGSSLTEIGCLNYTEDTEWDGTKLVALPSLQDITRSDLRLWFSEHTLVPTEQQEKLIEIALEDAENGNSECGIPLEVFERLRGENIPMDE